MENTVDVRDQTRIVGDHENRRPGINDQMDVALEMNGAAQISSRRYQHGASAGSRSGGDGPVNGRAVEMCAIAHRAISADIKIAFVGQRMSAR